MSTKFNSKSIFKSDSKEPNRAELQEPKRAAPNDFFLEIELEAFQGLEIFGKYRQESFLEHDMAHVTHGKALQSASGLLGPQFSCWWNRRHHRSLLRRREGRTRRPAASVIQRRSFTPQQYDTFSSHTLNSLPLKTSILVICGKRGSKTFKVLIGIKHTFSKVTTVSAIDKEICSYGFVS